MKGKSHECNTRKKSRTEENVLHELGVYEQSEMEEFVVRFFSGVDAQQLNPRSGG